MSNMSVLLVDDDPSTQSLFHLVMDHYDIDLVVVGDGTAALHALATQIPDAIVLDIFLPGIDGYKVLANIRASHTLACPIVAITGYYTTDTANELQQAGFDGYLLKPLNPGEIVPYIQSLRYLS